VTGDLDELAEREEFSVVGAYPAEAAALALAIAARLEDLTRLLAQLPPERRGPLLTACDRIIVGCTRVWDAEYAGVDVLARPRSRRQRRAGSR
jgi:hypothetical protein